MGGKQARFFTLTAVCSAVLGLILGAVFSADDSAGSREMAAAAGRASENSAAIGAIGPARQFLKSSADAAQKTETAAKAEPESPLLLRRQEDLPAAAPAADKRQAANSAAGQAPEQADLVRGGAQSGAAVALSEPRGVLNGYKGYRHHRPGYKNAGDGWWYPREAFAKKTTAQNFMQKRKQPLPPAGREKSKIAAQPPETKKTAGKQAERSAALSKAALARRHIGWCFTHHPSYNPGDNSYRQGFGGKRGCVSPYSRQL